MAAAFAGCSRIAATPGLAPFTVINRVLEAALLRRLVDLCAERLLAASDDVDRGLLAALELTDDCIHYAVLDERQQTRGGFHRTQQSIEGGNP